MRNDPRSPRLVHVTTIPMTLGLLSGQARFFHTHGFTVDVVSSPGDDLVKFGMREGVAVHGVKMVRKITPLHDVVALYRLWRLFRRLRPVIVQRRARREGCSG